jgi:hypothetical protein
MLRMSRLIIPGFPHHVTQRGVRSMVIFPDDEALEDATIDALQDVLSFSKIT